MPTGTESTALYRQVVGAVAHEQQGIALHKPRQQLVDRRAASCVRQSLGNQGRPLESNQSQ